MKNLSNYIITLLDEIDIEADYGVQKKGEFYVINVYLKGSSFANPIDLKLVEMAVKNTIDTYLPKGSVKCITINSYIWFDKHKIIQNHLTLHL